VASDQPSGSSTEKSLSGAVSRPAESVEELVLGVLADELAGKPVGPPEDCTAWALPCPDTTLPLQPATRRAARAARTGTGACRIVTPRIVPGSGSVRD
jgi:hypothetical protein